MLNVFSISARSTRPRWAIIPNTGAGVQVPRSISADQPVRHDAFQVARQPAAGDVAERADLGLGGQREAVLGVDAGRLEQLFAECAAELLDMPGEVHPVDLQQHLAGQRVTVGVQARRAMAMITSPGLTRSGPSTSSASTTPTPVAEMS